MWLLYLSRIILLMLVKSPPFMILPLPFHITKILHYEIQSLPSPKQMFTVTYLKYQCIQSNKNFNFDWNSCNSEYINKKALLWGLMQHRKGLQSIMTLMAKKSDLPKVPSPFRCTWISKRNVITIVLAILKCKSNIYSYIYLHTYL